MTILGSNPRAQVDLQHPDAFAVCDLCGFMYLLKDLSWQYQYSGNALINTHYLVCDQCLDIPFQNNRPLFLPPDPEPVKDARPAPWFTNNGANPPSPNFPSYGAQPVDTEEVDTLTTQSGYSFATQNGKTLTTE